MHPLNKHELARRLALIAPLRALVTSDGPRKWHSVTLPAGTIVRYLTT